MPHPFFIDAQPRHHHWRFPLQSASNGPLLDPIRFIPADAQELAGPRMEHSSITSIAKRSNSRLKRHISPPRTATVCVHASGTSPPAPAPQ